MGLFSKKKNVRNNTLNTLVNLDFLEGEFSLDSKLWESVSSYNYEPEEDVLVLKTDAKYTLEGFKYAVNDFVSVFGVDGFGDEFWEEQDLSNIVENEETSRSWYFDDNMNKKSATWATTEGNWETLSALIILSCDNSEDETQGLNISFKGWTKIKEFMIK